MSRENPRVRQLAKSIRALHPTVNITPAEDSQAIHRVDLFVLFFTAVAKAFLAAAFTGPRATFFATFFATVLPAEVFLSAATVCFFGAAFAAFLAAPLAAAAFFAPLFTGVF